MSPIQTPSLVSTLDDPNPDEALHHLSLSCHETASQLAAELSALLTNHRPTSSTPRRSSDPRRSSKSSQPIPLPKCLQSNHLKSNNSPLTSAQLASESILSSLTKIASGGSSASREMKSLESQRRSIDMEAECISTALKIRSLVEEGERGMASRQYSNVAYSVSQVNSLLERYNKDVESQQTLQQMTGESILNTHYKTQEIFKRGMTVAYESAVDTADLKSLSELTPLLGMVGMEDLGVRLYLRYSKGVLEKEMDAVAAGATDGGMTEGTAPPEQAMSRAALRRQAAQQQTQKPAPPQRLAKIYNAAVTHLRHHLPMISHSLGTADGDAALIQLVNVEAETRAVDTLRNVLEEKELKKTVQRAEIVASRMEERYLIKEEGEDTWNLLGGVLTDSTSSALGASVDISKKRNASLKDDCGFYAEVGSMNDVDAALEEWALMLQHTESYERFLRHAVEEVKRARKLREENKREEKKRLRELEEEKSDEIGGSEKTNSGNKQTSSEEKEEPMIEIMPAHTQLNEIAAEIGGYYSSLERCLLLAGMQRAFISSRFPDESTFTTVANSASYGIGSKALQTTLVEECLYAARRSTLRAFATGHTGTASAATNACVDVIGRILLEVLSHRAEIGASLLKPGEGLLAGQHGLGQAALSFAKSTAGKGLRGVQGAAALAGASKGMVTDEETAEALKQRTMLGVARAAANLNDLEVVADYSKKLEAHFLKEIDAGYPHGHETEQLRMCIKGLGAVVDSFSQASDRSMERLVSILLPRVRQIVNDAVGQEGGSTTGTASNFLGSPVLTGGAANMASTHLNYNLDDQAFEMAQISEGYMSHMCAELDEILNPLQVHLAPKLSDGLLIGILGGVSKRLEAAIRKSKFTPLGAISLDSDVRYFMSFAKDRIVSTELKSNVSLCKSCPPLGRLNQIALLLNVDDLEDALELISVNKRKGNWDLKIDDAKTLLSMRVDFEGSKVNDLLEVDES